MDEKEWLRNMSDEEHAKWERSFYRWRTFVLIVLAVAAMILTFGRVMYGVWW